MIHFDDFSGALAKKATWSTSLTSVWPKNIEMHELINTLPTERTRTLLEQLDMLVLIRIWALNKADATIWSHWDTS